MEIGSFIEMQFETGKEYYSQTRDIARLNSGRAAIFHALRVLGCKVVWLPVYQCETVRIFLKRKNIEIKYYRMDEGFNPINLCQRDGEAIVIVNYFGIMSNKRMTNLASGRKNVIIDNSQAFFSQPVEGAMTVYSARKFNGVPDGAYMIGKGAEKYITDYSQCYSSDTSLFLLERIEYGCEGKTYIDRSHNEDRIDTEDILKMSKLTRIILDGTNYDHIIKKRRENYKYCIMQFNAINQLNTEMYYDDSCVPMVYPLVIEDDSILQRLLAHKHFQGHLWQYILDEVNCDAFEYWLSRYMIPVTIDQRYGKDEIDYIGKIVGVR